MLLDRSRPYGEVWGAPGIAFVQGKWVFNHRGQAIAAPAGPIWQRILHDPDLARHELTANAAANTVRALSRLSWSELRRIARDEYTLHPGRSGKEELIQRIHRRIMEQS
ncbi:MAG: hypothetical protein HQL76_08865 [Magnetococcales bacterium]|nr:hypothetical protein [Magnetococcales bacterium]